MNTATQQADASGVAVEALLRAARDFLGSFADAAPPEFLRLFASGKDQSVTVMWRNTATRIFVTVTVDGVPHCCEVPIVAAGHVN